MRKFLKLLPIALICLLSGACTSNNGDIGNWFGTWYLEKITIDDQLDTEYTGDIFWQFQNNVVCMLQPGEYHTTTFHWGTWQEQGNHLILDYDHPRNSDSQDAQKFTPPAQVHMPAGIIDLTVLKMDGSKLTVSYPDATHTYIYYLKKQ